MGAQPLPLHIMISLVTGKIGGGKTTFILAYVILDKLAKGGFVLTNIRLNLDAVRAYCSKRGHEFHECQYEYCDFQEHPNFIPFIKRGTPQLTTEVVIDEAQLYYNAKDYRKLDTVIEDLISFLTQSRRFDCDLWFITQELPTLYTQIRLQAQWLYYCVDMRKVKWPIFGELKFAGLQWKKTDYKSGTAQEKGLTKLSREIIDCFDTRQPYDSRCAKWLEETPIFHPVRKTKKCLDSSSSYSLLSALSSLVGYSSFKKSLVSLKRDISAARLKRWRRKRRALGATMN